MNARDPNLPVQPDEAATLADFANRIWDDEIVPALTDYIAVPAKSPMFDAEWRQHGHIDRVVRDAASWVESKRVAGSTRITSAQAATLRAPTAVLGGWTPPP